MFSLISANWEWLLLALYVVEKVIKLSPSKKDDVVWDMVLKPLSDKLRGKLSQEGFLRLAPKILSLEERTLFF